MARFSQLVLEKVRGFLLEIHGASDVEVLRQLIPQAASRLISSDRANFNEFNFVEHGRFIVPAPVPAYWHKFGSVIVEHAEDHALFRAAPPKHRAQTFSDRRNDRTWTWSTLFNEYYRPIGVRHQTAIHLGSEGTRRFSLGFNRSHKDFSDTDRALLELIGPHVEIAWRNARELSRLRAQHETTISSAGHRHLILVDRISSRISYLSSETASSFRRAFGVEVREGDVLPDELNRWLTQQRAMMRTHSALLSDRQPLRVQRRSRAIEFHLARICPDSAAIVLHEQLESSPLKAPRPPQLTHREAEILNWIAEGKRNGEIATILEMSTRTVGKHVEHILEKLGVETRTAAARVAFEFRDVRNA